jgi:PEGA domain
MKPTCTILIILILCCSLSGFVAAADTISNTTGSLQISSNPGGATVNLDGVYKGITPEPRSFLTIINLTPKSYALELKKDGYQDYISTVKIVAGQTVTVPANLTASGETPVNGVSTVGVFFVIILVLLIVGFLVLYIRRHRKKPEPEKIELD